MTDSRLRSAASAMLLASALACTGNAAAREAPADAGATVVAEHVALAEATERIAVSGVVEPRASSDVGFQVGGKVARVLVEEGDVVREGQLLAELDPTDYALGLEQATLAHRRAADELRRATALRDAGSIAPNDFEKLESAERQLAVARDLAAKRLRDTRLLAPIAGTIARRGTERGETVAPGLPLFTLMDLSRAHLRVGVAERDVGAIRVGQEAEVVLEALGPEPVRGTVRLVGVAADPASRTYPVEIAIANASGMIRAGMVAEARLATPRTVRRLVVPSGAVERDPAGRARVWIVTDGAPPTVRPRAVTIGALLADGIEIVEGVREGESVVVAGQHQLRDGIAVRLAAAADVAAPARGATEGK